MTNTGYLMLSISALPLIFLRSALLLAVFALPTHSLAQTKIGLSLPLSGSNKQLAQQFLVGAQLALKIRNQVNQTQIELTIADDACDVEIGKLAAQDLLAAKVSIITGLLCNVSTKSIASFVAESEIPLLVAGARSERLIKDRTREGWNIWRLSPGDNDAANFAAEILSQDWAAKPYAIIDDGTVYGRNSADAFRSIMEDKGFPPQFTDNYRPTQSTQARLIRRLRRAGITHVFVGGSAEDVAMIARNSAALEIPLEIVGGETLSIMPYLPPEMIPPDGLKAVIEKSAVAPDLSNGMIALLETEKIEPELHVLAGYQAIEIAYQAVTTENQTPLSALETASFDTLLGSVSFIPDGKNKTPQYGLFEWQGGKFIEVN